MPKCFSFKSCLTTICLIVLFFATDCYAQYPAFTELPPLPTTNYGSADFQPTRKSSLVFGDVDSDGDQDYILTGESVTVPSSTVLYLNDGSGFFSESTSNSFDQIRTGTSDFEDVDNDGDLDLFLTGRNSIGEDIAKVYYNNGTGIFTIDILDSITGVNSSSAEFSDINNDGDVDVLISGWTTSSGKATILYENDGLGNFTEIVGTPFIGMANGDTSFGDVDNDGDEDVVVSGDTDNGTITQLYLNDGLGNFTLSASNPFVQNSSSEIELSDINGDGNLDLICTGYNASFGAKMYLGDGNSNFTETTFTNSLKLGDASIDLKDFEGDGDVDILISGRVNYSTVLGSTEIFLNDGLGAFTEVLGTPFYQVWDGSVEFSDVNNDGLLDVFVTGYDDGTRRGALYINLGNSLFQEAGDNEFGVWSGTVNFADIDNDNDDDLFITGSKAPYHRTSVFYRNDGQGNYTENIQQNVIGSYLGAAVFGDLDSDSDLDLIVSGSDQLSSISTRIYTNDGTGVFTLDTNSNLEGVYLSAMLLVDINANGNLDLIYTGENDLGDRVTKIYVNNGQGVFSEQPSTQFTPVRKGSLSAADVDLDGDMDIMLCGEVAFITGITELYLNDGAGNYSVSTLNSFSGIYSGQAQFSDLNMDGYSDVLIAGFTGNYKITQPYLNDGIGLFTASPIGSLTTWKNARFDLADVDNDSDPDVLLAGWDDLTTKTTEMFINDGTGYFLDALVGNIEDVNFATTTFGHIDNDGKIDLIVSGYNDIRQSVTLYKNTTIPYNAAISEIDQLAMSCFPNPTSGMINFNVSHLNQSIESAALVDELGRVFPLELMSIDTANYTCDISKLEAGVYRFILNADAHLVHQKIIKI